MMAGALALAQELVAGHIAATDRNQSHKSVPSESLLLARPHLLKAHSSPKQCHWLEMSLGCFGSCHPSGNLKT